MSPTPTKQTDKQPAKVPRYTQNTAASSTRSKRAATSPIQAASPKNEVNSSSSPSPSSSTDSLASSSNTKASSYSEETPILQTTRKIKNDGSSPSLPSTSFRIDERLDPFGKKPLHLLAEETTKRFVEGDLTICQRDGETTYYFEPKFENFPAFWELITRTAELEREVSEEKTRRETAEANLQSYHLQELARQEQMQQRQEQEQEQDQARWQELELELSRLKNEMEDLRKLEEHYRGECGLLIVQKDRLEKCLDEIKVKENCLGISIKTAEDNATALKDRLSQAERMMVEEKAKNSTALQGEKEHNQTLQSQLQEANKTVKELTDKVEQFEQKLADKEAASSTLHEQLTQARQAQAARATELQLAEQRLSAEEAQVARLLQQLSDGAEETATSTDEKKALRDALGQTQRHLDDVSDANTALRVQLAQVEKSLSTEKALVATLRQEADEVATSADEIRELRNRVNQQEKDAEDLQRRLSNSEAERDNLRSIAALFQSTETGPEIARRPRERHLRGGRHEDWSRFQLTTKVQKNRTPRDILRRRPWYIRIDGNPRRYLTPDMQLVHRRSRRTQ